ncbi:MAG: hypothetical protein AB7V42_08725 [Thermoleophilia bacterium]
MRAPLIATAVAALAIALPTGASAAPGDAAIARADALAQTWARCPTSRPAHRALSAAKRTTRPRARAARARAALRAWNEVARACSQPVPQPTAVPGS